jgi:hypothetical protein
VMSFRHLRRHRVFVDNLSELQSPLGFSVAAECCSVSLHSFCVPVLVLRLELLCLLS